MQQSCWMWAVLLVMGNPDPWHILTAFQAVVVKHHFSSQSFLWL